MAAITSLNGSSVGIFAATPVVLTADDTITFKAQKKQLLVLRNDTAGPLTATLDGDGATSVNVPGVGVVSVAAGFAILLAAGEAKALVLGTVNAYCKGVVHLLGGTGLKAQLFDF